jgi:hypothetical protein
MKFLSILIIAGIVVLMGGLVVLSEKTIKKNGGKSEWIGEPIYEWIQKNKGHEK